MSAGTSIHPPPLLLSGPGALFQSRTSLPWVVLWRCLFPVLSWSLTLTAQLSPAELPALPRGSKVLPCLVPLQGPIHAWLSPCRTVSAGEHTICAGLTLAPALTPWSQTTSPCRSLASTRLEKSCPSWCLLGPGQDTPSSQLAASAQFWPAALCCHSGTLKG